VSTRAEISVPLHCGAVALITVHVDPAPCLRAGHLCPSREEIAALIRAAMRDAEAETRARD
jgi:hypothetical protein